MTYGTAITCRFGPVSMPGPAPERAAPSHGMTWAEMARSEGHRPGVPRDATHEPTPRDVLAARILAALLRQGPMPRGALGKAVHRDGTAAYAVVSWLEDCGLVEVQAPAKKSGARAMLVALTDAGRAKAEAGR